MQSLCQITTQWSKMENLDDTEGPRALANFLAAKYYQPLAMKFRQYHNGIDELKAYELASDVLYELIKNDYRGIKRLDRKRGKLRGLFFVSLKRFW